MLFSKTFGYAIRGILYVAMSNDDKTRVQLDEIAEKLSVPRHFLGKVMKDLVKEDILRSMKGPYGGFYIHEKTMGTTLMELSRLTGDRNVFESCVLRLRKCNASSPCPMHKHVDAMRNEWQNLLATTTIGDLMNSDKQDLIKSIATV